MGGAGDAVRLIGREQQDIRVADVTRLYAFDRGDLESLGRALAVEALPESWKGHFQRQLGNQPEADNQ
ncbi:MAG TPA: 3-alpha domain-containing protein [Chthoniobacterales bacterium]|nr:3-alpha domain-containing protein [Chthoniobacterales bacterium]